jgi:hypothetical protein
MRRIEDETEQKLGDEASQPTDETE